MRMNQANRAILAETVMRDAFLTILSRTQLLSLHYYSWISRLQSFLCAAQSQPSVLCSLRPNVMRSSQA